MKEVRNVLEVIFASRDYMPVNAVAKPVEEKEEGLLKVSDMVVTGDEIREEGIKEEEAKDEVKDEVKGEVKGEVKDEVNEDEAKDEIKVEANKDEIKEDEEDKKEMEANDIIA